MAPQPPSVTGRLGTRGSAPLTYPTTRTANRTVQRSGETAPATTPEDAPPSLRRRTRTTADPVTITIEHVITGRTAEVLCDLQVESFEPLETLAIQKQSDSHDDLLQMFASPDFTKVVAWQSGQPIGLGVLTNVLERIPEISPRFLRERYPQHAARNAIYVGIYVTVAEEHRGITLFSRISTEMWNVPARVGGVLVFDMCEFNRTMFAAEQVAEQVASVFPHSSVSTIDRQTWFAAELPEPIPER
jgi:hypothetical protein